MNHLITLFTTLIVFCFISTVVGIGVLLGDEPAPGDIPAIDTSALMGDPFSMPLTVEVAFPGLEFDRPLEATFAPDGSDRLYVVEQAGRILTFEDRDNVRRTDLFLDIQDVVSRDGNEEGLLGLAFHPDYESNGRFYVYYSTSPRASVVSEFRRSAEYPLRADRDSERELMRIPQPYGNHNGGSIRFGHDGFLYIGLGDGGSAHDPLGNGQNLKTWLGSLLRIDVDRADPGMQYAIPEDNPFADRNDGARGEIWAYGLRNIWRLSVDSKTGDIWLGDVGQNRYEEVNIITRGGNYGWNIREGFHPFEPDAPQTGGPLIEPLAEYFHSEGLSVTGGLVYRGDAIPEYEGAYFYGDYVSGQIWMLRYDGASVTENHKVARTGLSISAFGADADGEILITSFDGRLYRLKESDGSSTEQQFPLRLSETDLFNAEDMSRPNRGMIPYEVNVPLWSDHALKPRHMVLPEGGRIGYSANESWEYPIGSVLVKDFYLDLDRIDESDQARRLETRLFIHSPNGWKGYTYVWDDEQNDATLIEESLERTYSVRTEEGVVDQSWYFPSSSDCMACHTEAAGWVLGPNTRQLNLVNDPTARHENQIDVFERIGLFENPPVESFPTRDRYPIWDPDSESRDAQARAYLDVNCAFCHAPGGIGGSRPDLRYAMPLDKTSLIGRAPKQGQLGPEGSTLITPGRPDLSELLARMSRRGARQMPPLATNVVDQDAIELLTAWIEGMADSP